MKCFIIAAAVLVSLPVCVMVSVIIVSVLLNRSRVFYALARLCYFSSMMVKFQLVVDVMNLVISVISVLKRSALIVKILVTSRRPVRFLFCAQSVSLMSTLENNVLIRGMLLRPTVLHPPSLVWLTLAVFRIASLVMLLLSG